MQRVKITITMAARVPNINYINIEFLKMINYKNYQKLSLL